MLLRRGTPQRESGVVDIELQTALSYWAVSGILHEQSLRRACGEGGDPTIGERVTMPTKA